MMDIKQRIGVTNKLERRIISEIFTGTIKGLIWKI